MACASRLARRLASPEYRAEYEAWRASMDGVPESEWTDRELMPDPAKARVRVYATHSTHKSLSALRQGSMIQVWDQDLDRLSRDQFGEAYLTHTSTSPNQQLIASLDLARRQVDLEGYGIVRATYQMALAFRERIANDPVLRRWYRVLDIDDLVPARYRSSGVTSYLPLANPTDSTRSFNWDKSWRSDEFVLDPTRVTLYLGRTGMTGFEFREQVLMERFGIQINKTSVNSVLLIFTIGVTWSSLQYLLDALRRTGVALAEAVDGAGAADRSLMRRRTRALTAQLPPLPDFSAFDAAFRLTSDTPEGDIRSAMYAAYEPADREYLPLPDAQAVTAAGRKLVSAGFVVPYPPGFPVLVPGQVIESELLTFLTKLDIKEIHGYNADLGLCVFTEDALNRYAAQRGSVRDRAPAGAVYAANGAMPEQSALAGQVARSLAEQPNGDHPPIG
jgi:arginine decarboxylase